MELSEKLLQLRKSKGWTQANAAKIIDIQQSYLSKLENGHYVPSHEVIVKLCDAYQVKVEQLIPKTKKQGKELIIIGTLFFIALGLLLSGYLALFYPSTYYTYKTTPNEYLSSTELSLSFHLTDQYNGEQYSKKISGVSYNFELVAQRKISRKENRWLIALGYFLIVFVLTYLIFIFKKEVLFFIKGGKQSND